MLKDNLIKLGFTQNQIKTYLSLFELGQSKAGQLIAKTKLHRNLVYTALEDLEKRGLVTKVLVNNVAQYHANDPESLISEIESKKIVAENAIKELGKIKKDEEREIQVIEGVEGIKRVRMQVADAIGPGEDYFVLGASSKATNPELEKFWPKLNKMIDDRGGNVKVLVSGEDPDYLSMTLDRDARVTGKLMSLPIASPMWFSIFRDVVNISIAGDSPITFKIKNQETAEVFKKYFDYFWSQDVVVRHGTNAIKECFYEILDCLEGGEEYRTLGTINIDSKQKRNKFLEDFHRQRIKKGIKAKLLGYRESIPILKELWQKVGDPDFKVSRIKEYSSAPAIPMQIVLYKNRTHIIVPNKKDPVVFSFSNIEINKGFKNHFDYLWEQTVRTYSGWAEIEFLFMNELLQSINKGDKVFVQGAGFGETGRDDRVLSLFNKYNEQLVQKGGGKDLLFYERHRKKILKEVIPMNNFSSKEYRPKFLPDNYYSPMQIHIYNNKAVLVIFSDNPVATVYEDPQVVDGFKKQFEMLWGIAKF